MHAFVDESIRGSTYLMCAVLVAPGDLATVRRSLTSLRLAGQQRIHLKKESPPRRRLILDRVATMPLRAHIYAASGERLQARGACIRAMIPDLLKQRTTRLIIEPVDGLIAKDQSLIRRALSRAPAGAQLTLDHVKPKLEPILWAADVIAWGYGAKGDWRRRVGGVIEQAIVLEKREARIMSVRTSSGLTS